MGKAKMAVLVSAALASGSAAAAPPIFGQWTVTDGVIDPCSDVTNATSCEVLVSDFGFVQAQISIEGETFIKSIVTDNNADSSAPIQFWDENYIRIFNQPQTSVALPSLNRSGFLGRMVIDDSTATQNDFVLVSDIATGWGMEYIDEVFDASKERNPDAQTYVRFDQDIISNTPGLEFDSQFLFEGENGVDEDGNTVILGSRVDIEQVVALPTIDDPLSEDDIQNFFFYDRRGTFLTTAGVWGSSTDDANNIDRPFDNENFIDPDTGLPGTFFPEFIAWDEWSSDNPNPQMLVFWIDQSITTSGFGEGSSDFYHLQADSDGAGAGEYAFSQAGAGFVNANVSEMEAAEDWLDGAELVVFPNVPQPIIDAFGAPSP